MTGWRTPESRQNRERDGKPRNTDSKGSDVKPAAGQFRKETALKADGRFFQLCALLLLAMVGPTRCFVESILLFLTCVHNLENKRQVSPPFLSYVFETLEKFGKREGTRDAFFLKLVVRT